MPAVSRSRSLGEKRAAPDRATFAAVRDFTGMGWDALVAAL